MLLFALLVLRLLLWCLLGAVVAVHFGIVFAMMAAAVVLPMQQPWCVWLPLEAFIAQQFFGGRCPVTNLENRIRRLLGMREIKGFIRHYFFRRK